MNTLRKIYCRAFQKAFKFALPFLPYRNPEVIGSVKSLPEILLKKKCDNVLIITDKGIRNLGLTDRLERALKGNNISYSIYDKTVANPTTVNVKEAEDLWYQSECKAIIGFGGGSSMGLRQSSCCAHCKTETVSCTDERHPESTQKASTSDRHSYHCRNRK